MRIIAGTFKGRHLTSPPGQATRPTSDSLRETLFNILGPGTLDGAAVLDGFAGTGAVGLEALSRGAARVTFVERDRAALKALHDNIQRCGVENACAIVPRDLVGAAASLTPFDFVFLDPPYDATALEAIVESVADLVTPTGRLVLEHRRRRTPPSHAGRLQRGRTVEAGDSALSFYNMV